MPCRAPCSPQQTAELATFLLPTSGGWVFTVWLRLQQWPTPLAWDEPPPCMGWDASPH